MASAPALIPSLKASFHTTAVKMLVASKIGLREVQNLSETVSTHGYTQVSLLQEQSVPVQSSLVYFRRKKRYFATIKFIVYINDHVFWYSNTAKYTTQAKPFW